MKNKRWHSYIWMFLCMAILLLVMPVSGTAQAQVVDGYWELTSVDVEKATESTQASYNISRGTGTFRADLNGDSFQATMTWTEPGQRYAGGQSIDLTISVIIDEYAWYNDTPGYTHMGLNYMNASISARIDEPDVSYGGITRGAISLTDPQGEYLAQVSTDNGKIVVGSQTLKVSAPFPSGGSEGDEKSIYVNCTAGMNRYNYQWVEGVAPPIIPEIFNPESESGSSNPATNSTAGQLIARVIVVSGIAIAGTLSTIVGELANKAAQPAGRVVPKQPAGRVVPKQPAGRVVPKQPAGQVPKQPAEPGLDKMTPAEKQQLQNQIADYKTKLIKLRSEEIAWRKAQRNAWELYQKAKAQYQSNSVKVIVKFGKEIGDGISTILNPTGKIVNLGAEKFTEQVVQMATAPVPSDATDAEILELQRKKISDIKEKYEEAKRMRAQKNSECVAVEERINGLNARLKNSYLVPWH